MVQTILAVVIIAAAVYIMMNKFIRSWMNAKSGVCDCSCCSHKEKCGNVKQD